MGFTFESRFVCLLIYILCLHAAGIFFFTTGFLLSRNELPIFSTCDDVSAHSCPTIKDVATQEEKYTSRPSDLDVTKSSNDISTANLEGGANEEVLSGQCSTRERISSKNHCQLGSQRVGGGCWTAPAVKRVVILVLDALRFDFVAPSSILTDKPKPWMDKLEVMQRFILEEKSGALMFKFIADPPTTSLQRLKGLTTGSLPTFVDIGNSFGAPAILEDNLLHQLASNGKRVLMMGDDTWLQLFPTQFAEAHPFPSFNVKDLHTVDDGVIDNLFPALYKDNWDVLIGHFLGMDHVGHIFGVESSYMVEKLEQYNRVIENVVSILQNESYAGGMHEDTLLLVMGDHGQTLNGDHGGGALEEVETALFAMSTMQPARSIPINLHRSCSLSYGKGKQACINTFPQLDFAATLSALVGVPFPFGSIGKVNPELFALVDGTWPSPSLESVGECNGDCMALKWMKHYHSVLCMNSWQVNRYFKMYAESAISGFPSEELSKIRNLYDHAQSFMVDSPQLVGSSGTESDPYEAMDVLSGGIDAYSRYLDAAAALARSKWTQFGSDRMAFGLVILFCSFTIHVAALYKLGSCDWTGPRLELDDFEKLLPIKEMISGSLLFGAFGFIMLSFVSLFRGSVFSSSHQWGIIVFGGLLLGSAKSYIFSGSSLTWKPLGRGRVGILLERWRLDLGGIMSVLFITVYACSLLSNSYILKEGHVATFLLASSGIFDMRQAVQKKSKVLQALLFLGLNSILGCLSSINVFKDTEAATENLTVEGLVNLIVPGKLSVIWHLFFTGFTAFLPLAVLGFFFVRRVWTSCILKRKYCWLISIGIWLTYMALFLHWLLVDLIKLQVGMFSENAQHFIRLQIPRMVYFLAAVQTIVLVHSVKNIDCTYGNDQLKKVLEEASVACLAVWSGLILLLLGRRGPLIALVAGIEGWCLMDMQALCLPAGGAAGILDQLGEYPVKAIQWNLFAVQLFFCTGHRCSFDGLRYAAAFIGFDQFNIYRQGILLAADTFGASHMLPIIGLALLASKRLPGRRNVPSNTFYKLQMSQAFLLYGWARVMTTIFTTVCVTIQRRHLMVWGLFAPKFVFDAVGLLVTDIMLIFASLYHFLPFFR